MPSINIQQPSYQPNNNDQLYKLLYNFMDERSRTPSFIHSAINAQDQQSLITSATNQSLPENITTTSTTNPTTNPTIASSSDVILKQKIKSSTIDTSNKPKLSFLDEIKNKKGELKQKDETQSLTTIATSVNKKDETQSLSTIATSDAKKPNTSFGFNKELLANKTKNK